jgi:hypothetical protein
MPDTEQKRRDLLLERLRNCGKCYGCFQENVAVILDGAALTDDQVFVSLLYLAVIHEHH